MTLFYLLFAILFLNLIEFGINIENLGVKVVKETNAYHLVINLFFCIVLIYMIYLCWEMVK